MVAKRAHEHPAGLDHLDRREHRHVAGALRDRRHQPASRLSAVVLGHVYPTKWDWATYAGTLGFFMFLMFLFVRAAAVHFDIRGARGGASRKARGDRLE